MKSEINDKPSVRRRGKGTTLRFLSKDWLPIPGLPIGTDTSATHTLPALLRKQFEGNDPTFLCHTHDWSELVIIHHGTAIHHVGSHSYHVSAGDIFVIQPNVPHYFSEGRAFAAEDIYFNLEKLPLPLELLRHIPGFNMLMAIEPQLLYPDSFKSRLFLNQQQLLTVRKLVDKLNDELCWKPNGFQASAVCLLTQILILLARNYSLPHPEEEKGWLNRINDAILTMEQQFAEPITVTELARTANTSPRNFQRRFRNLMGARPIEHLNAIRLRHAAEKLASGDMPIADVAHSCGFNDLGYFYQKFHAEYGQSPLQYRKANRTVGGI